MDPGPQLTVIPLFLNSLYLLSFSHEIDFSVKLYGSQRETSKSVKLINVEFQ